jgi:hypothetical protein
LDAITPDHTRPQAQTFSSYFSWLSAVMLRRADYKSAGYARDVSIHVSKCLTRSVASRRVPAVNCHAVAGAHITTKKHGPPFPEPGPHSVTATLARLSTALSETPLADRAPGFKIVAKSLRALQERLSK